MTVERATVTVTGAQDPDATAAVWRPDKPEDPAAPEAPAAPEEAAAPALLPAAALPPEEAVAVAVAATTVTYLVEVSVPMMVVVGPVALADAPAAPELAALVAKTVS